MISRSRRSGLLTQSDELMFASRRQCRRSKFQETLRFPVVLARDVRSLPTPVITARVCAQILDVFKSV